MIMLKNWKGINFSEVTREEWSNNLTNQLRKNPEMEYNYCLSGNNLVLACRRDDGKVEIFDCKLVRRGEIPLEPTEE
jgi:hypothetical protein